MAKSLLFFLHHFICLLYIALALTRSSAGHVFGNETDRLALLAFKDQSAGQELPKLMTSWNTSLHFCYWGGVTCSHRHQRVVKLDLSSQGLTGSISPYIGNLSFLRSIVLRNNSLHGEIPPETGRLFRLKSLDMGNNSLSGNIPVSLSQCLNLERLGLYYNKLTGSIPEEFGSLNKLTTLNLASNNLTGTIPSSFGNLSSIQELHLGWNSLSSSIPHSLGQLKRITFLALHENFLSGMVPPSFYNLSSLEDISLTQNQLEGSFQEDLGLRLPNLRQFLAGINQLSGSIPRSLFSNATRIKRLELSSNNFTGDVPIDVGSLTGLEILNLEINHLGSGGEANDLDFINSLTNCSHLRLLSLANNNFGGPLPESISNLSITLDTLYLGSNKIYGGIPSDIRKLVNLIALSLKSNFLTGIIPNSIGTLQKLQLLLLDGNNLTGEIPRSVGNITSLYLLNLSGNILEGNIVTTLGNCRFLEELYLAHNHLTGTVPKQVFGLSGKLRYIDLSNNNMMGSLPLEVGNVENLQGIAISENEITGEISAWIGSCLSLEELYLHGNFFQGSIPSSFSSLKGIQDVDLSQNNLSGKIPKYLETFPVLENLNLSFNNFEGEVPIKGIFQTFSAFSIAGNKKLCGGIVPLHLPKCHIQQTKKKGSRHALKVILGVLLPSFLVMLFLCLAWYYLRKKPDATPPAETIGDNLYQISYNELRDATNGFSLNSLIGMGSYGSVFKGVLRKDGSAIAVKAFNLMAKGAARSFMAECGILREVRHRNLLKIVMLENVHMNSKIVHRNSNVNSAAALVDFQGNDFKALVFMFMTNGSLEEWLHQSSTSTQIAQKKLSFIQRLNIAIDVASALDYLHNNNPTPIIHCDLKPSNVLLDDDMVAHVGDFGLAKFLIKTTSNVNNIGNSSHGVRGTIGYIPPEYGMGAEVSAAGDVYSYGIMLLEMFTGKRPTDEIFNNSLSLHSFCKSIQTEPMMEILDMHLRRDIANESTVRDAEEQIPETEILKCLTSIIEIGVACSTEAIAERMNIKDVLKWMHKIKEVFARMKSRQEI